MQFPSLEELKARGTRKWTVYGEDVLPRALIVPQTARRNALGPQFDPAAFLVTHGWIDEHIMLVLDDPEDPTPYWLIATKNPQQVLDAFLDPAARPSAH